MWKRPYGYYVTLFLNLLQSTIKGKHIEYLSSVKKQVCFIVASAIKCLTEKQEYQFIRNNLFLNASQNAGKYFFKTLQHRS